MVKKILKRVTFPVRMWNYRRKAKLAFVRRILRGEDLDERDFFIELDNQMNGRKGQ